MFPANWLDWLHTLLCALLRDVLWALLFHLLF
jgi:hypothetical protein